MRESRSHYLLKSYGEVRFRQDDISCSSLSDYTEQAGLGYRARRKPRQWPRYEGA